MPRRSFFAWLLGLLGVTRQQLTLEAAQPIFDDAILLKPPQVTRMAIDTVAVTDNPLDDSVLQIQIDRGNRLVWLHGTSADVDAFCRLYQDKLWPGWQDHTLAAAVERDFQRASKSWAAGSGALALHSYDALDQTIKAYTGPFVIV